MTHPSSNHPDNPNHPDHPKDPDNPKNPNDQDLSLGSPIARGGWGIQFLVIYGLGYWGMATKPWEMPAAVLPQKPTISPLSLMPLMTVVPMPLGSSRER